MLNLKNKNSEEIMTFTALAMCAGFSYLAYFLHLSPAVGAFLAGSIVAGLPNAKGFEKAIAPYNIIISSFFFIAIGTLIDFTAIKEHIMVILVFVLTVIIIKLTAFSGIIYFFANMKGDKMFFSSIAMFSVGEFSLLVAKESLKFDIGIDLISISAAIIAISAIIMSLTINYSDRIYQPAVENLPWKIRKNMDKFATYIRAVSDEIDLDNKYSRGLRRIFIKATVSMMIILLVIFGFRKIQEYISLEPTVLGLSLGFALVAVGILLFYFLMMLRKIIASLAEIFDNATNTRSNYQSRLIVKRAFAGFILLWVAMLWPFAMFIADMSPYAIAVSLIMLGMAIWQFHRISQAQGMEILESPQSKIALFFLFSDKRV